MYLRVSSWLNLVMQKHKPLIILLLTTITVLLTSAPITSIELTHSKNDCVLLLHGLGRTHRSMKKIQTALETQGYDVKNINYPSRKLSINELADTIISPAILSCDASEKIHFITHSLGGIITRVYLEKNKINSLGKVIMLAPPNNGTELAEKLNKLWFPKYFLGPSLLQLSSKKDSFVNQLSLPTYTVGIIAGTSSLNPLSSYLVPGKDDGKVSVANATLPNIPIKLVSENHTWIMKSPEVIDNIIYFLNNDEFLD
jgi:triacylglycerol lipase